MKKKTVLQIFVMILGLVIMSLGIAVSTKAELGTTPISCIPYVLSLGFPLSFGMLTFIMNSLFVVLQYFILRERFESYQWLQVLLIFVFGACIDLSMYLVSALNISGYLFQWIFCLFSCVLVGLGIALLLKGNLLMMSGDALARAVSWSAKVDFGHVKVGFDLSMVIIASLISIAMFSQLEGVREGTFAAAVLVGLTMKFFAARLSFLDQILLEKP
jgi:uncharacterized membrane protein YczE